VTELQWSNPRLNESQREAVMFALRANEVALIHGPPGTGKTTTLIELILQLICLHGDDVRILACGPSNISVGMAGKHFNPKQYWRSAARCEPPCNPSNTNTSGD
jgi:DNA polymerase alpha-associated DNA helicase A